jgi:redox-regulated HSP33 family molecular chaperone
MLKTLSILIAATLVATPALAETLVHDGKTYTYTVEQRGKVQLITGEETTDRRAFTLKVRNGWVEGVVDGNPVSFSTRDVIRLKPKATATEVAAR